MIRERDRAVRARRDVAALTALDERRIPSPIEQQDALIATRQALAQFALELVAHDQREWIRRRLRITRGRSPHVDDLDLRETSAADTIGQREAPVLPRLGVRPALETRRRAA
jgi:hypothetical protein